MELLFAFPQLGYSSSHEGEDPRLSTRSMVLRTSTPDDPAMADTSAIQSTIYCRFYRGAANKTLFSTAIPPSPCSRSAITILAFAAVTWLTWLHSWCRCRSGILIRRPWDRLQALLRAGGVHETGGMVLQVIGSLDAYVEFQ